MDTQRLILFFIFSFSLLLLWDAWEKQSRPKPVPAPAPQTVPAVPSPAKPAAAPAGGVAQSSASVPAGAPAAKGETLRVQTDPVIAEIDTLGGTLSKIELLKHKHADDPSRNLCCSGRRATIFAERPYRRGGPNHRTPWKARRVRASWQWRGSSSIAPVCGGRRRGRR